MKSISLAAKARSLLITTTLNLKEFLTLNTLYSPLIRKRLEEVRLTGEQQLQLTEYPDTLHFLLLLSPDDPDTVAVLPLLVRMAAAAPRIDLHIMTDEDDLSAVDQALLNEFMDELEIGEDLESIDLPLLFILDEEWGVQESWGPRPVEAEARLEKWLTEHPEYETLADDESEAGQDAYAALLDELTYAMRIWYNSGINAACIDEVLALMKSLQSNHEGDGDEADNKKNRRA